MSDNTLDKQGKISTDILIIVDVQNCFTTNGNKVDTTDNRPPETALSDYYNGIMVTKNINRLININKLIIITTELGNDTIDYNINNIYDIKRKIGSIINENKELRNINAITQHKIEILEKLLEKINDLNIINMLKSLDLSYLFELGEYKEPLDINTNNLLEFTYLDQTYYKIFTKNDLSNYIIIDTNTKSIFNNYLLNNSPDLPDSLPDTNLWEYIIQYTTNKKETYKDSVYVDKDNELVLTTTRDFAKKEELVNIKSDLIIKSGLVETYNKGITTKKSSEQIFPIKQIITTTITTPTPMEFNITVCGLFGDKAVINTILQGINIWNTLYSDRNDITINFIFDISGILFSDKFEHFYTEDEITKVDVQEKFSMYFDSIIDETYDIQFNIRYCGKHIYTYKSSGKNTRRVNSISYKNNFNKYIKYKQKYLNISKNIRLLK